MVKIKNGNQESHLVFGRDEFNHIFSVELETFRFTHYNNQDIVAIINHVSNLNDYKVEYHYFRTSSEIFDWFKNKK